MKRTRILGLALAGVLVLLAISAVSASAAPEWGACVKAQPKSTGEFSDKACSVSAPEGNSKYELVGGSIGNGKKAKVKGLSSQILHIVVPGTGDVPITCRKLKGSYQPVAPDKEKEVTLEFQKCTMLEGSVPCENVARETIKTQPLAGVLAEVSGKVGSILSPEAGPYLAEFECRGVFPKDRLPGQVFGEYTGATNVISKTLIGHYTVGEYLGEPFPETEPGYRPITNVPTAGPPSYGVLYVEVHHAAGEGEPEGWDSVPAGQEGEVEVKGEALMIKT
jgi:hypothetical protein